MRDKSPDPAALIRAGRTAFRPESSDRERVLQSLTRTLGEGAFLDGPHHADLTRSLTPSAFPVRAWVLGGLGAIALGGTVIVAAHPWTSTSLQVPVPVAPSVFTAEPSPAATLPPSPNADDREPEPQRAEGPSSALRPLAPMARSSIASRPSDSLQEEVRILSRAEQQLNSGHADEALKTLAEHERRFPDGALAEERMAARVQSLCALGRVPAARADLAKFAHAYPRSPYLDRARRFCDTDAP
jgi:hypothetical protein